MMRHVRCIVLRSAKWLLIILSRKVSAFLPNSLKCRLELVLLLLTDMYIISNNKITKTK